MLDELDLFGVGAYARAATRPVVTTADCVQWRLQKNCSLTPRQLATCLVCFSLPGLLAGVAFFALGAPMILALLVLQIATLAGCFVQYARHAADCECLTVTRDAIEVDIVCGASQSRSTFRPAAASLQLLDRHHNLIAISERNLSVRIGASLPRHLRPLLFQSLSSVARRFQ